MSTEKLLICLIALSTTTIGLQVVALVRQMPRGEVRRVENEPPVKDISMGMAGVVPDTVTLDLKGIPTQGHDKARVVLIEFSDYECPFCARHAASVLPGVREQFVSNGKVRYAFVDYPLPIHGHARMLAVAAACADKQGVFWPMHDLLFESNPRDKQDIIDAAVRVGVGRNEFEHCTTQSAASDAVDRNMQIARMLGIRVTPSFAVGRVGADGRIAVHKILSGVQPLSTFQDLLKVEIAED